MNSQYGIPGNSSGGSGGSAAGNGAAGSGGTGQYLAELSDAVAPQTVIIGAECGVDDD